MIRPIAEKNPDSAPLFFARTGKAFFTTVFCHYTVTFALKTGPCFRSGGKFMAAGLSLAAVFALGPLPYCAISDTRGGA